MKKTIASCMLIAASFTGLAACGSSSKPAATTAKAGTAATVAGGGGGGSTNAAVTQYCNDVDAIIAQVKAAKSDPTKLQALTPQITKFATDAQALITANPADAAAISACSQKAAAALTAP